MEPVLALDGCRPGLAVEMAKRGLHPVACERQPVRAGFRFRSGIHAAAVPMLVVVAGADAEVTAAIDAGAEDAVPESASDALIAARLAALVRRATAASHGLVRIGDLVIDRIERRVMRDGDVLDLLPREYRLLLHLAEASGRAVPLAELRRAVWGLGFDPGTNVVAVHVSRLRAKLDRGFAVPLLLTEKGVGYRLAVPEPEGRFDPA